MMARRFVRRRFDLPDRPPRHGGHGHRAAQLSARFQEFFEFSSPSQIKTYIGFPVELQALR
jgi:hypothetical protein